ncbi:hypothetical protein P4K64_00360 [Bacillus cereus]
MNKIYGKVVCESVETKTSIKQKKILEHFNIPRETLVAMEKEGLPFYKTSARDKEYDIEQVAGWLKGIRKDIDSMVIGKIYVNGEITKSFKCANCHRRLHVLNDENDVMKLKGKLEQYKNEGND